MLAYIAELEEEMTGALSQEKDVTELWTEIRTVTDLMLRSSRCLSLSTGRTLGLAVVGQYSAWLNLSTMGEKIKTHFLDQLIDPKGLFEPAVAAMQQQFEANRREQEAFRSFVPCKAPMQRQTLCRPVYTKTRPTGGKHIGTARGEDAHPHGGLFRMIKIGNHPLGSENSLLKQLWQRQCPRPHRL
ncbi:putative GAG protein [Labeo rohita]|nr:putative GAG protein [Labeo rohita]